MTLPPGISTGSPFGAYGPVVSSIVAIGVVVAAVADHLLVATGHAASGDPFLDSFALLAGGVVLGVGAIGGAATNAHVLAAAANTRLDAIGAPPARDVAGSPGSDTPAAVG